MLYTFKAYWDFLELTPSDLGGAPESSSFSALLWDLNGWVSVLLTMWLPSEAQGMCQSPLTLLPAGHTLVPIAWLETSCPQWRGQVPSSLGSWLTGIITAKILSVFPDHQVIVGVGPEALELPTQGSFTIIEILTFLLHLDKFRQKVNNFKWTLILLRLFIQMVKI